MFINDMQSLLYLEKILNLVKTWVIKQKIMDDYKYSNPNKTVNTSPDITIFILTIKIRCVSFTQYMEKEYESSTDVSNMKFIYIQNHNFELFCSKFAHILKKVI